MLYAVIARAPVFGAQAVKLDDARARMVPGAAEKSGWNRTLGAGLVRGIAGCFANQSYVAHVVEVTVSGGNAVRVDRVVSAVDCGTVVNPSGTSAQVEGSILQGLSTALREEITVTKGRVDQRSFDSYALLRFREAPSIDVHFIDNPESLGGLGEPAHHPHGARAHQCHSCRNGNPPAAASYLTRRFSCRVA